MSVELEREEKVVSPVPMCPSADGPRVEVASSAIAGAREDFQAYRAMCSAAMASFGIGIISILALVDLALGVIPVVGILLGIFAARSIRSRPDELTGMLFARVGLVLSASFLLTSWAIAGVVYATEVPEGFERVAYSQLQPEPGAVDPVPPSAVALEGKRIFIKGYIHPSLGTGKGLKRFVMVRDNGDCCFGAATPKLTDMIYVQFKDPLRMDYTTRVVKIAGTFHVEQAAVKDAEELGAVLYHLEAEHAQ
jgi:hypothetical protein